MRSIRWIEISATLACWIGIFGLIFLITRGVWAADAPKEKRNSKVEKKGGLKAGVRSIGSKGPIKKTATSPQAPSMTPPPPAPGGFFDDEDDDEDDDAFEGGFPGPGPNAGSGSRVGGAQTGGGGMGTQIAGAPRQPSQTYSAGGVPKIGNDPVSTPNGLSVGSSSGVPTQTTGKTISPIKIDVESGRALSAQGRQAKVINFNFPNASIMEIAKTLGRLTGTNFIYDEKDVKGTISIITNSPITIEDAWNAFQTALDVNNFALLPSGSHIRITRQRDARDKQVKIFAGNNAPNTDALITRLFPLRYINAEEVQRTFRGFMPPNARLMAYDQTNTLIVTDTGSNIAKLAKMLEHLDIEGYDAGIEVVQVKYASAADLSKLIDTLLPGTSAGGPGSPPGVPRFGGAPGRFNARRTKEGGIINNIISDDRTNNLIVHANQKGVDQVKELVAKLDKKYVSSNAGGRVHVVYLQFAEAEQIANTLNNFSSQAGTRTPAATPQGGGGIGVNPASNSLFESAVKISPDKQTNSLVITASPADFVTVKRVINKLDIPRDQVYVKAVIMEVAISRNFDFSANVFNAPNMIGSVMDGRAINSIPPFGNPFTGNSNGALIGFPLNNGTTEIDVGGRKLTVPNVFGLIRLLQTTGNANILATPQITALDNTEATFESAEKIPVATTSLVQGVGAAQSITKESVALSITIKPQINKLTNFVKMDIQTKMGGVDNANVPAGLVGQAFGSVDRTAKTSVVVADADTIVIGGLIRDHVRESVSKVPLLGDIPLLGWLFRSKTSEVRKNNLLIFLTPHIVKQYEKVRTILDQKLKERDDFIETTTGGEDLMRKHRDDLIRSLPDINEITKKRPEAATSIDDEPDSSEDKPAAVLVPKDTPAAAVTGQPAAASEPAAQVPVDPSSGIVPPPPPPPS